MKANGTPRTNVFLLVHDPSHRPAPANLHPDVERIITERVTRQALEDRAAALLGRGEDFVVVVRTLDDERFALTLVAPPYVRYAHPTAGLLATDRGAYPGSRRVVPLPAA